MITPYNTTLPPFAFTSWSCHVRPQRRTRGWPAGQPHADASARVLMVGDFNAT
jgi:hypothetical protein